MKKKFLDTCRAEKLAYCLVVREMDNPALSLLHQEDFSELLASYGGGAGTGDRSEEHTSELQSRLHLVCRLLLEKKKPRAITLTAATTSSSPWPTARHSTPTRTSA